MCDKEMGGGRRGRDGEVVDLAGSDLPSGPIPLPFTYWLTDLPFAQLVDTLVHTHWLIHTS